ncbi:MAG: hypothetical protein JHC33_12370 [Ignisphaera sp.]|nr:hypothetical protein [Ignisphaera sp.]
MAYTGPLHLEMKVSKHIFNVTGKHTNPSIMDGMGIEPDCREAFVWLWASVFIRHWDTGWSK